MLNDDDMPRPKPAPVATPPLDRLGVEELQAYVLALRSEIERAEIEIGRKKSVMDAAHGFFARPDAVP